ncbi:hypothetical protein EYC80_002428 [Monilinia laxa]|uniref:Uncharacterized protein n=1 Tax=Monilinia laxa TaxID=61186 RepID=A0A5N6K3V6_MONLA|nr:hypothetical protein EYC80_002428 [Monilinia laxa]
MNQRLLDGRLPGLSPIHDTSSSNRFLIPRNHRVLHRVLLHGMAGIKYHYSHQALVKRTAKVCTVKRQYKIPHLRRSIS